jgi:hypothetical protein
MAATDPTLDPEPVEEEPAQGSAHEASYGQGGCPVTWCPICVTVGAVQPLAPDVMEHLLKAGTELFMALRAVIDARADEAEGSGDPDGPSGPTSLEKIDLG